MGGRGVIKFFIFLTSFIFISANAYSQDDDSTKNILKQGLLGAGTGAIAAGTSGGKAGQGALVGAGTAVIGSALLDAITTPSKSSKRAAYPQQQDDYYYDDQDYYYEEQPAQESSTQKVLKQGLIGAGTGALAAGTSGGKAGQGALVGAGTAVIGSALLDMLTQPSQPQGTRRVYRRQPQQQVPVATQRIPTQNIQVQEEDTGVEGGKKKVIKKYDSSGKLISEEEIYY